MERSWKFKDEMRVGQSGSLNSLIHSGKQSEFPINIILLCFLPLMLLQCLILILICYLLFRLYWDSACHEGRPGPGTPQNCTLLGQESTTTIVWDIPSDQQEGVYRIRHYGNARRPIGPVVQYVGTSSEFQVVSNDQWKIKSKSI